MTRRAKIGVTMHARTRLLALLAAAPLLVGCVPGVLGTPGPTPSETCSSGTSCTDAVTSGIINASFSQAQALPDFDSQTYVVTDGAALAELEQVLVDGGVGQESYDNTASAEQLPGSLSTWVTVDWQDGTTSSIAIVSTDDGSDFETELVDLISAWRESGDFEPITVP